MTTWDGVTPYKREFINEENPYSGKRHKGRKERGKPYCNDKTCWCTNDAKYHLYVMNPSKNVSKVNLNRSLKFLLPKNID